MSPNDRSELDTGVSVGESVLVVGAGAMGRWIAGVFGAPDTAFVDTDDEAARTAAEGIDGRVLDAATEESFDLVVIAVPISEAEEAIETHGPRATEGIVDVTGVMRAPLASMAEHAPGVTPVSLHPLFAPERAPGRIAMIDGHATTDPDPKRTGRETDSMNPETDLAVAIETALRTAGNDPFVTTAAEHDAAMESVQARTHAAVLAFALTAEPIPEAFHTPISEELTALAARITDGTPRTYAEIQSSFEGAADIAEAADRIAGASPEEFTTLYREAADRLRDADSRERT